MARRPAWLSGVALGDGAMGTALFSRGFQRNLPPDAANLLLPGLVAGIHRDAEQAGARWVRTNTFGANAVRFAAMRCALDPAEVNRAGVRLAREAAPGCRVIASMGPVTGPAGGWQPAYEAQVEALIGEGPDGLLLETMTRLDEAIVGLRVGLASGLPVWVSYTPGPDGNMLDGASVESAAETLYDMGAEVIGVNCGAGMGSIRAAIARLADLHLPALLAMPSAGLPADPGIAGAGPMEPDAFADAAIKLVHSGVVLIGGCCGTEPAHIRALQASVAVSGPPIGAPP